MRAALLLAVGLLWPLLAQATQPLVEDAGLQPRYLLAGPDGGAVSDGDFPGRYQLIAFGYTFCPDVCPTTLVDMSNVLRRLGERADQLQPIFITVDPERDSGERLQTYTRFFDPRILGLRGSPDLTRRVAANFRVRYARVGQGANYAVDHSAGLYLLGRHGEFIRKYPYGTPADAIADDLGGLLGAARNDH